jgi:hypothetical protein
MNKQKSFKDRGRLKLQMETHANKCEYSVALAVPKKLEHFRKHEAKMSASSKSFNHAKRVT